MGPHPTDKSSETVTMTTRSSTSKQPADHDRDSLEYRFDCRFLKLEEAMVAMAKSVAAAVAAPKKPKKKKKREVEQPQPEEPAPKRKKS